MEPLTTEPVTIETLFKELKVQALCRQYERVDTKRKYLMVEARIRADERRKIAQEKAMHQVEGEMTWT